MDKIKRAALRLKVCDSETELSVLKYLIWAETRHVAMQAKPQWFYRREHQKAFVFIRAAFNREEGAKKKARFWTDRLRLMDHEQLRAANVLGCVGSLKEYYLRRRVQDCAGWLCDEALKNYTAEQYLETLAKAMAGLRKEIDANKGVIQEAAA